MMDQSALYQEFNSHSESLIDRRFYDDYAFFAHFHSNPEIVYVFRGSLDVEIDGFRFSIGERQFCLVLPWQVHSYRTERASKSVILVFPAKYIQAFAEHMSVYRGETQVFCAEPLIHDLFVQQFCGEATATLDEYIVRSVFYALCHCFADQCRAVPVKDAKRTSILVKAMNYISEHFNEDLSLASVAEALGYSYCYLSHVFIESSGVSFHRFCNMKRIEYARTQLENTARPVIDIAFECGFPNARGFNRVFRQVMDMTPREYRVRYSLRSGDSRTPIFVQSDVRFQDSVVSAR